MPGADYDSPQRVRRTLAEPQRRVEMTPAQARAQDSTAAILRRYADAAEAHLRVRAAQFQERARDRMCPCGIVARDCRCELWRAKAGL